MKIPELPATSLTNEEAYSIYGRLLAPLDENDEDASDLLGNLYAKAARYANIRAEWLQKTREQKMDEDPYRTSSHDSFITAVRMIARFEGNASAEWTGMLDMDDRKRIGDFACWLAMRRGIEAR